MSNHNRIVAHFRISNPEAVPVKYTRRYNEMDLGSQAVTLGADELLLLALAQKSAHVHKVGGNVVTFGPKATKRVLAKLGRMGLKAVVEFGRVRQIAGGEVIVTDGVDQKKYAATIAC